MSDYRPTLIVPGLHGSGAGHWQTWWQQKDRNACRIEQPDWSTPALDVWARQVRTAVEESHCDVWIVAHSFGCLASLAMAKDCAAKIKGMFLVAPADPDKFAVTHKLPNSTLPFPTVLVASRSDPWLHFATARHWAAQLGSRFVDLGDAGHINIESGFGAWQAGFDLFGQFAREVAAAELIGALCE